VYPFPFILSKTGWMLRLRITLGLNPVAAGFGNSLRRNLTWIALWLLAAVGVKGEMRAAYFPLWFFAVGMVGNAIWHPLLCLATGGYFPGLFASPFAGIIGVMLLSRLRKLTAPGPEPKAAR
jgi:hypothetical protein